jgi:hypothetical protein
MMGHHIRVGVAVAVLTFILVAGLLPVASGSQTPAVSPGITPAILGQLTILPNGSLSNPNAPIIVHGNYYNLTSGFYGWILVLRAGAILNGEGNLIHYYSNPGTGKQAEIWVQGVADVTVEYLAVANGQIFGTNATDGVVANQTVGFLAEDNWFSASTAALLIENSTDSAALNNFQLSSTAGAGIRLFQDRGLTISSNNLANSSIGIEGDNVSNLAVTGNTATNESLYAASLSNTTSATFDGNFAQDSSNGIKVSDGTDLNFTNNNVSFSNKGIGVNYAANVSMSNNTVLADSRALWAQNSENITFSSNQANASTDDAVWIDSSSDVRVLDNDVGDSPGHALLAESDSDLLAEGNMGNFSSGGFEADYSDSIAFVDNNASFSVSAFSLQDSNNAQLVGNVAFLSSNGFVNDYGADTLVANNTATDSTFAAFSAYDTASTNVTGNDFADSSDYGVYDYFSSGVVVQDNILTGDTYGVFGDYPVGLQVLNNVGTDTDDGVYSYENYGGLTVAGNDLSGAQDQGVYVFFPDGAVSVVANNLSDSARSAIDLVYSENVLYTVEGNNLSNSGSAHFNDILSLTFIGNNALNVSSIGFSNGTGVVQFYHNDLNTPAFNATGATLYSPGWNAPYPLGGNYWSGYSGVDRSSGPAQDLPGSDGIGDSPMLIPTSGAVDSYPLMRPWTNPTVILTEDGLPLGGTWSVTFDGAVITAPTGTPIIVPQVNGAWTPFNYSVGPVPGYVAAPGNGSGIARGTDLASAISFVAIPVKAYTITFNESGLPVGTSWSIRFNGRMLTESGNTIPFPIANGTYRYSISSAGYEASPSTGTLDGTGTDANVSVVFRIAVFDVTFYSAGLPSGSSWSVSVAGLDENSTGPSIAFDLANGSYPFVIMAPSGYLSMPANGTVQVSGGSTNLSAALSPTSGPSAPPPPVAVLATPSGISLFDGWILLGVLLLAFTVALVGWVLYLRERDRDKAAPSPPARPPGSQSELSSVSAGTAGWRTLP